MKKLPKSYDVFGLKIKVTDKFDYNWVNGSEPFSIDQLQGLYIPQERTIWINPRLNMEEKWRTFYHEVGHALMFRMALPYGDELSNGLHEMIVEGYGNFMYEKFHCEIEKLKK